MTTILTDEEMAAAMAHGASVYTIGGIGRAVEAAVIAKIKAQPFGQVTVVRREGCVDMHWFYKWPEPPYLDNAAECRTLYTLPGDTK